jgi:hypothetical protein
MSNSPNPFERPALAKASVFGVGLAVFGVIAFLVIWVLMGNAGVDNLPRLLISLCVPPLLIVLIVGGYVLVSRR